MTRHKLAGEPPGNDNAGGQAGVEEPKPKTNPDDSKPAPWRHPPAYQEYASDMNADRDFLGWSALECGCYYRAKLECWVNVWIPRDSRALARVLRFDEAEVEAGFTPRVLARFTHFHDDTDGHVLLHTELERYREALATRHKKKVSDGRDAAKRQWEIIKKRRQRNNLGSPGGLPKGAEVSREEKKDLSTGHGSVPPDHEQWVEEFEGAAPTRSRGRSNT